MSCSHLDPTETTQRSAVLENPLLKYTAVVRGSSGCMAVPGARSCGKNPGIRSPYLHGRGRIGGTTQSGLSDMEHPSVSSDPHNSIAHIIAGVRGRTGHSRCSGMLALERRTSECSMGRYRSSSSHLDSIDWGRDQSGLRDPVSRFRDLGG